jgi:hypothetical protein
MLHRNHERVIAAGLSTIERRVIDMIVELRQNFPRPTLRSVGIDLNEASKTELYHVLMDLLSRIDVTRKAMELPIQDESLRWRLITGLAEIMTIAEDLKAERLNAYGQIADDDGKLVNGHIHTIVALIDLARAVANNGNADVAQTNGSNSNRVSTMS